jgi:hypothetical protein
MWMMWIGENWDELEARKKLTVPSWFPHPATVGFKQESITTPAGQCRDWVLPLSDESRIHVHEFEDGRLVAHRDKYDPNSSPLNAIAHFVHETEIGRSALLVALFVGGVRLLSGTAT